MLNLFRKYSIELLLVVLVLCVFGWTCAFPFVKYDDNEYVYENPHIAFTGANVLWAMSSLELTNWHPLTWISYMVDHALFGLNPAGYHIENLILHLASVLILYRLLSRMTGQVWPSAFVAAMFAIHPMRVESVAWVAERKDVLSVLFGLLAVWAYVRYTRRPGPVYLLVPVFFALSLMSKSMLVTLPCVLLLLDYWPLRRLADGVSPVRLLTEKTPLFALSLGAGLMAMRCKSVQDVDAVQRLINVPPNYMEYIVKTIWPARLSCHYRILDIPMASVQFISPAAFLLAITVAAFAVRRRHPYVLMGWLWFLGTLAPVIGLIQVGTIRIADRYTYFSTIGLFIAVAFSVAAWAGDSRARRGAAGACAGVLVLVMAATAFFHTSRWRDNETLFKQAVAVDARDHVAHYNLGCEYLARKRVQEAYASLSTAVQLKPTDSASWTNLGMVSDALGNPQRALECYQTALEHNPKHVKALINLGILLAQQGRYGDAEKHLADALALKPDDAEANFNFAVLAYRTNRFDVALDHLKSALDMRPDDAEARYLLALSLLKLNRAADAVNAAQQVLQLRPNHSGARDLLKSLSAPGASAPAGGLK